MRLALVFLALASPAAAFDIDACTAKSGDAEGCTLLAAKVVAGSFGPLSAEMCAAYEADDVRHLCYDAFLTAPDNPYFVLREEFDWRQENPFAKD